MSAAAVTAMPAAPTIQDYSPHTPVMASSNTLRSISTEESFTVDKARLRVSYGGSIVQDKTGRWKYHGGDTYLESVPMAWRYTDLMYRLVEKTACAVAVKYLLPGEELDPDSLITVADDDDLQEMFEEYQRGLRIPGTPIKTFRLRVLLFPAAEEPFTPEELADGEQFFSRASADRLVRKKSSGRMPALRIGGQLDASRSNYSSVISSGSASPLVSAAASNPHEDANVWQAGFEAGQEAAAWARNSSASFDAETLKSPVKGSRTSAEIARNVWQPPESEDMMPDVVALAAQSVLSEGGGIPYWQASDKETYTKHDAGDSGGFRLGGKPQQLPSHISVFGSPCTHTTMSGPPEPALPPVTDMVTSGVRLPSHISAFGDESSDERMDSHLVPDAGFHLFGPPAMGKPLALVKQQPANELRKPSFSVRSPKLNIPRMHCIPQDEVKVVGRIGEGAFGEVSLANSPLFGQVAIKWLKPGKHLERSTETFWGEAEVLASVNHPNVLRFYGVVVESHDNPVIVGIMTEYMRGGSLADMIRHRDALIPLVQRAEIALSAVKGLAYLHEMRIVHFDLKPDNLLLDTFSGGTTVKVADFGLHKHKRDNQSFVSGVHDLRGTLPYMAPELVSDPTHVSEKADVWSLGMVLWEMLTLQVPFANLSPQQIVAGLMVGNLQPPVPDWCEPAWRSLLEACWEVSPAARPNLRDIGTQLEAILQLRPQLHARLG